MPLAAHFVLTQHLSLSKPLFAYFNSTEWLTLFLCVTAIHTFQERSWLMQVVFYTIETVVSKFLGLGFLKSKCLFCWQNFWYEHGRLAQNLLLSSPGNKTRWHTHIYTHFIFSETRRYSKHRVMEARSVYEAELCRRWRWEGWGAGLKELRVLSGNRLQEELTVQSLRRETRPATWELMLLWEELSLNRTRVRTRSPAQGQVKSKGTESITEDTVRL